MSVSCRCERERWPVAMDGGRVDERAHATRPFI